MIHFTTWQRATVAETLLNMDWMTLKVLPVEVQNKLNVQTSNFPTLSEVKGSIVDLGNWLNWMVMSASVWEMFRVNLKWEEIRKEKDVLCYACEHTQ